MSNYCKDCDDKIPERFTRCKSCYYDKKKQYAKNSSDNTKKDFTCKECGEYKKIPKWESRTFCSQDCLSQHERKRYEEMRETEGDRFDKDFRGEGWGKQQRKALERDDYRCQNPDCEAKGDRLHVHHITPYNEGGSNELHNLVTVCSSCHSSIENRWRRLGTAPDWVYE